MQKDLPILRVEDRLIHLKKFKKVLQEREPDVFAAAREDLGKAPVEAYFEMAPLYSEIDCIVKNLKSWAKESSRTTPLALFPGKTWVEYRPQGRVLVLGAWNYPFLLTFAPVINALSAGNQVVCKPSELSPRSADLMKEIVEQSFPSDVVSCELGGRECVEKLFHEKWDHIFYTGGERVGKIVAERAAKDLTRFTLELGGKSPFVVDRLVDLQATARKLVFGKFSNCGQTCVAPDYVLVHQDQKERLAAAVKAELLQQYSHEPLALSDYGRIVNRNHFDRLQKLVGDVPLEKWITNSENVFKEDSLQISPIVVDADGLSAHHELRTSEIFGPILPILSYSSVRECQDLLKKLSPTPLCSYFFTSQSDFASTMSESISPGAVVVNDVLAQLANPNFPFGGVRTSGMGRYRGHEGFKTFSNPVSVYKGSLSIDFPLRYRPYSEAKLDWLKRAFEKLG